MRIAGLFELAGMAIAVLAGLAVASLAVWQVAAHLWSVLGF